MITVQDDNMPVVPQVADTGEETFDSFSSSLPDTAQGFLESAQEVPSLLDSAISDEQVQEEKRTKVVKMSRKMKKSMDKLKAKAANFPVMWFHQKAKANPEWELDEEEKDLLTDSIETVFELLDINVEIEPIEMTFRSMYWVIIYPIGAFAFLFLTKKSNQIERENRERGLSGDV